ncbi:MAG: hypothetical protein IT440_09595 [Phycisphaeraceae bacterium]|nr:hypothetical protein [Phycisphaeraceae bacterium]
MMLDLQALDAYRLTDRPVDYRRLRRALRREEAVDGLPLYELFSNVTDEAVAAVGCPPYILAEGARPMEKWMDPWLRHITYQYVLGYDHVAVGAPGFGFPRKQMPAAETAQGKRSYIPADLATISTREEFEKYPWPNPDQAQFDLMDRVLAELTPPGMSAITACAGILEHVMWLMSYEGISMALYDDPDLVKDMFDAVGSRIVRYYELCTSRPGVFAIQMGEDMGHKTQTMLAPEVYRKYLFPWHRKLVETVHANGKLAILHSCGHLDEIMDDILDCGWDAKHSFEDTITSVWEFKRRYGDRIAVLGGFDIDKFCRMTPEQVRQHTRMMIDRCTPAPGSNSGGWAMGSGNSIANYIPMENFLAMLREALSYQGSAVCR